MKQFILFLVITFVVWIFNLISQNKAKGHVDAGPRRPVAPPRDRRVQNEIDVFLKEIGEGQRMENAQDDDIFIEVVSDEERIGTQRHRRPGRTFPQQKTVQPQPVTEKPEAQPPVLQRLGSRIAERVGPGSADLGDDVSRHVSVHMREGMVAEHVRQHLSHDVNQSVFEHLGTSSRDSKTQQQVTLLPPNSLAIAKLLHNPSGMRQAFLLSEILPRPKGLRRSS